MSPKASPVTTPQRWMIRPIMNPRCIHFSHNYALTMHNLSPPVVFKQRSHPMIEKQSQSQRHKVDDETHHVSLNSFISSISLHWQDTCHFSKNKSSHDIAIIVDDKTNFSWPCREGPPTRCAFTVPIPAVLATAVFFQFPFPGVIENAVFFQFPFLGMIENAVFFQFPFPDVIENAVFFQFPFPGVIETDVFFHFLFFSVCEVLCFSSSLSLSQFPSSSLHSSLPSSLRFSKESALQLFFFKRKTFMFSPHLCVGFLVLVLHPVRLPLPLPSPPHTQLAHTQLAQTQLAHIQLAHTQLAHTQLAHTQLAHTQLAQTQLAHIQLTHTQLTHIQLAHIQPAHTRLAHTQLAYTQLAHIQLTHTHNLHTHTTYSVWQAWHLMTSTFTLCGRRGTWWHGSSLSVAGVALAGVALVNTWIVTLRGRRGAYGTGLALVARLVSHGAVTPRRFAWQAWHFVTSTFTLCGRRGTWRHRLLLCVAGVALMALGWLWWRAWSAMAPWRRGVLRGRRGTSWHLPSLCVAGVALRDIYLRSTFTLCGRRGTWWHGLLLCVAGVALMALGWLWWRAWSAMAPWRRSLLRGRRGTSWHLPSLCVAGVALRDIYLRFVWQAWHLMTWIVMALDDMDCYFAWQAWHLWHWVGSGGALGQPWRHDAAAFCVAGVALRDICLHFVWQAWHFVTSTFDPPSLCVASVALDDMDCYFAWQAWHLWHWVGSGGALGQPWRRDAAAFCVAGVALRDICLHFVWQAWHFVTSTFYPPSLCVAGVALDDMDCYFAWQAWHLWH